MPAQDLTKSTRLHFSPLLATAGLLVVGCQPHQETPQTKTEPVSKSTVVSKTEPKPAHNPYYSRTDTTVLNVPDATWKKILPPDVYAVAREKDTEQPFTGKYNDFDGIGTYYCAICGNKLFRSTSKFASTCGWPSFFEAARKEAVIYQKDTSYGMTREEVLCGRCKSHLGHVFDDGPPPTGKRFCMNSIVLDFEPDPFSEKKPAK